MRAYLSLGLFFYYKKIHINNFEGIPKTGAVMFLANHQNALIDPLLIATQSGRFSYFLTRANVFQNVLIGSILKSFLMLPVYRIRDGWEHLTKNKEVFKISASLLSEEKALMLFPEASHNLNRTVRPLSKGFTRIIIETLVRFPNTQLHIIPVGLNYTDAVRFGDSVAIHFGKPILLTSALITDDINCKQQLKDRIFKELCQLTTHIETEHYEDTLKKLNDLKVNFLHPEEVNSCIKSGFTNCQPKSKKQLTGLKSFFKVLVISNLLIPYLIWKFGIEPKIKELEFVATFRYVVAISIVPIYLIITTTLLALGISMMVAVWYLLFVLIVSLLSVKL
jgi:1-acyl-sn-glycerol-3-phosphate acyltransferase